MMRNGLSSDTATHVTIVFGVYLDNWFLQKWYIGFEQRAIVCFLKQSKGDLRHTENVCFISS